MAPTKKKNVTGVGPSAPLEGISVPSQEPLVPFQIIPPPLRKRVIVEEWGDSNASQPGLEAQQAPVMQAQPVVQ